MRRAAFGALVAICVAVPSWSAKAPFTFEAMMRIMRVDDPHLSPDGKLVAFTGQTVDLGNNTITTQIYVLPTAGGPAMKITDDGTLNTRPQWRSDSKRIFFVSNRKTGNSYPGTTQVWSANPDGSDVRMLTAVPTGASDAIVSPDNNLLLFTSNVYPSCEAKDAKPGVPYDVACNESAKQRAANSKMNARVYTSLLYRHWTEYAGTTRRHLLIETMNNAFAVRDLTPGNRDTPPFSLEGPDPYAFSPDSVQIAYVSNQDPDPATSTNSDIYLVNAAGGEARKLTNNLGADEGPIFSPDGRSLAYRSQLRAGFESDQWRLAVMDLATGALRFPADSLDRWVSEYVWSSDSKRIFFTVEDRGTSPLLMVPAAGGDVRTIIEGHTTVSSLQFSKGERVLVYLEQSGSAPAEINMTTSRGGNPVQLTHMNDPVESVCQLTPMETMESDGADGAKIESFVVKPPDFDPAKRYPVLFLIHGGPQGDWGQSWSYRWNPQIFAGAGYLVIMPNPHGSVGYGQSFTDAVSGDWGGRAYIDLMAVADAVAQLPYADKNRMAAAGASYGGYMIDWILGHTTRFKALVSHAGVFDLRSEAGTTDELWFVKWEFKGFPWENATAYDKWSPSGFVQAFRTPTLVTQGEIDYRVPIGQSQELFTALKEKHIPSKLVLFPDEGHWIFKPQDSRFWYQTVLDWLDHFVKP